MVTYGVITEIGEGNYACDSILIDPDGDSCIVGSNIIVSPQHFDEKMFVDSLQAVHSGEHIIDLTKKQILMCQTPVFSIGEILIIGSNDRTIPDGRKPSKWDVTCEYFKDIRSAIKRSKEVYNKD
jgi:hypothetical protein